MISKMFQKQSKGVKQPIASVGNFVPDQDSSAQSSNSPERILPTRLRYLAAHLGDILPRLPNGPLPIEQLQMLEAELRNQGFVTREDDITCSLAQYAIHEENMLRWRAQRSGLKQRSIHCFVDVGQYLISRARQLIDDLSSDELSAGLLSRKTLAGIGSQTGVEALKELGYFEQLAEYFSLPDDSAANRYQAGLDVVLRSLTQAPAKIYLEENEVLVTLPTTREEFLKAILQTDSED